LFAEAYLCGFLMLASEPCLSEIGAQADKYMFENSLVSAMAQSIQQTGCIMSRKVVEGIAFRCADHTSLLDRSSDLIRVANRIQ